MRAELDISRHAWAQACVQLSGRIEALAALAVIAARHACGAVRSSERLLRTMVEPHGRGELRLDKSLLGLMDRPRESDGRREEGPSSGVGGSDGDFGGGGGGGSFFVLQYGGKLIPLLIAGGGGVYGSGSYYVGGPGRTGTSGGAGSPGGAGGSNGAGGDGSPGVLGGAGGGFASKGGTPPARAYTLAEGGASFASGLRGGMASGGGGAFVGGSGCSGGGGGNGPGGGGGSYDPGADIAIGGLNSGNGYVVITPYRLTAPIPEPASLALFGTRLAGLGLIRRRRRG